MRYQTALLALAATAAVAAPVADYAPKDSYPSPSKPSYGGEVPDLGAELGDAALKVLKWKISLLKAGAKIILTPAELAYEALNEPDVYDTYQKKAYSRDADYAPKPEYSPAPTYGGEVENPFEVLGDAALEILKFKLFLLKSGAKIILSPFELLYTKIHDVQPSSYKPAGYDEKTTYARDYSPAPKYEAPAPKYESPAPKYQPETPDLLGAFSEAALDVLKFKLYLLSLGAKIILSPIEAAYNDAHHPSPAVPYAGKTYY